MGRVHPCRGPSALCLFRTVSVHTLHTQTPGCTHEPFLSVSSTGKNAVYHTCPATRLILTSASAFTGTCAGFPAITAGAGPWACAHNSAVQATPLLCMPSASRTPMAGHKVKNDILLWLVGLGLGCFVCLFVLTCFSFSYVRMLGGACAHVRTSGCGSQRAALECWEPSSDPLQEQYTFLTTKPSLQPGLVV